MSECGSDKNKRTKTKGSWKREQESSSYVPLRLASLKFVQVTCISELTAYLDIIQSRALLLLYPLGIISRD